jgi:hypothetical protein
MAGRSAQAADAAVLRATLTPMHYAKVCVQALNVRAIVHLHRFPVRMQPGKLPRMPLGELPRMPVRMPFGTRILYNPLQSETPPVRGGLFGTSRVGGFSGGGLAVAAIRVLLCEG